MGQEIKIKSLYFLHLPKTAGTFVNQNVTKKLDEIGLKYTIDQQQPFIFNWEEMVYIGSHLARYPIDNLLNLDLATATIIRNPIERSISHFNMLIGYEVLSNHPVYSQNISYLDKVKYFLFKDEDYKSHYNLQARHICNSPNEAMFNVNKYQEFIDNWLKNGGNTYGWTRFINNDRTSLDFAKHTLDNIDIVEVIENLDVFMQQINNWFNKHYGVTIPYDTSVFIHKSDKTGPKVEYTTKQLVEMLTEEEKNQILKDNDIDYALYLYVLNEYHNKNGTRKYIY
jgi:hypothetical protein